MKSLKEALSGETYEFTKMYPGMAKKAASDGDRKNEQYFTWTNKVEEGHAKIYQKAIDAQGKVTPTDYTCAQFVALQAKDSIKAPAQFVKQRTLLFISLLVNSKVAFLASYTLGHRQPILTQRVNILSE